MKSKTKSFKGVSFLKLKAISVFNFERDFSYKIEGDNFSLGFLYIIEGDFSFLVRFIFKGISFVKMKAVSFFGEY